MTKDITIAEDVEMKPAAKASDIELATYMLTCCLEPVMEAAGFWTGVWCLCKFLTPFV